MDDVPEALRQVVDEPIQRFLQAAGSEQWRVVGTEVGATWVLEP